MYLSRRWFNELSPAFFVFPRGFYKGKRTLAHLTRISQSPSRDSLADHSTHLPRELATPNLRLSCLSDLRLM
jgi:hypothetical protein